MHNMIKNNHISNKRSLFLDGSFDVSLLNLLLVQPQYFSKVAVLDLTTTATHKVSLDALPVLAVNVDEPHQLQVLLKGPFRFDEFGLEIVGVMLLELLVVFT